MMRQKLFSLMLLLLTAMTAQAQVDFKLYVANNVGEVSQLSRLKMTDSGLNWKEVKDGDANTNLQDVADVKKMFSSTRQKTREDQKLFWKMRDDNLLCFRINDGSGKHGEFEARAMLGSGRGAVKKNVSNYFFLNTDNHADSLFISVNRKGCSSSPNDTLHFKYYIYDYGNEDLIVFKLDSRRQKTGLTYQLEYVTEDYAHLNQQTTTLELSGSNFQSFYRPDNRKVADVFLVSNGNRLKLDRKRLLWGANLSDKQNRLWMGTNFTLDKHENRELTIFNMLGSGLFEQYDTLFVKVMGDGVPVKAEMDPQTKLAKGFTFNVAEVDANGNYVKRDGLPMKYAGYDPKNGIHKILTYGNPCYMEVYAPGYYPALLKYAGAVDPTTKVLDSKRSSVTLRLVKGTANATDPAVSRNVFSVLKDEHKEQMYDGKKHEVFTRDDYDMNETTPSSTCNFIEDGGRQLIPKLLDNKPIEKYAELAIEYSVPKSSNTAGDVAQIQFEEQNASTVIKTTPVSTTTVDGNSYPTFQRSWYTLRWNMVGVLPKVNVNYKPRLTIGSTTYHKLPFVRRMEYNEQKGNEKAKKLVESYAFNSPANGETNLTQFGGFAQFLGEICRWDLRSDNHPGFNFVIVPYLDIIRGRFEVDASLSIGFRGDSGEGFRESIKNNARVDRWRMNEGPWNFGQSKLQNVSTAVKDEKHWINAEMDDIFKVERNKLGKGFFLDVYAGCGIKWSLSDDPEDGFYLKAFSGGGGYGFFASAYSDPERLGWKGLKWLTVQLYFNAVAQAKGTFGIKTFNFKENGSFKERVYGFFLNALIEAKAGGGLVVGSDFNKDNNNNNNNNNNENPEGEVGGGEVGGGEVGGGEVPANARAFKSPVSRRAYSDSGVNRWFSFSFGVRFGGKAAIDFGIVSMFNKPEYEFDWGFSATLMLAIEAFIDIKAAVIGRVNPRFSAKVGGRFPLPNSKHNPTTPIYPNYIPVEKAPRRALWQAPAVPEFPIGKCIMDGLDNTANPCFMQDNKFLIVNNSDGSSFDNYRLTDYTLPSTDQKIDKADGTGISPEGHFVQHPSYRKEIDSELMIYEEMTKPVDDALMEDVDDELQQARHIQIASSFKSDKTGEWKHHVVAYDADKQDSEPVAAINVWTEDGYSALPGEYDEAACVWKRGQYVLPPYEKTNATQEENEQARQEVEDIEIRAFEGDVMLSVFDGQQWGAPESVVTLDKEDILLDYQTVMRNDTVLVALSVVPKDTIVPELRYYCKPAEEAVRYVGTDKLSPIRFSLDLVGSMPVIAILNQVDSANKDIYVKHIDMMGRYMNYGTDLAIARFNPESVRILVDKDDDSPEDFAILWRCPDREIRRDGKVITTDSTQTMLNCSRVYLRENMTTIPYVTLGCTADSTYISGYDAILDGGQVQVLYALTDERNGETYLMKDAVEFYDDFKYSVGYSQEAMIDADMVPVNLTVYNTGSTPITFLEGKINDQDFQFDDIFIYPYSSQTLAVDYELPENFDGLLRAHDVTAIFEDTWIISKESRRRGAPRRHTVTSDEEVTEFAAGTSDLRCELLSHTIEGSVNKVYLELTDFDGLHDYETVHVGLYPDHLADIPICSSAEEFLKASDFTVIGNDRKAYVELTVDGLEEAQEVEVRARVYNDKVLDRLGDEDDISEAIVDNLSWQDNQRSIILLPVELDIVTLLPVVKRDDTLHKVKVEQTEHGAWISGLEVSDHVRIFDALGKPIYQQSHPQSRLFVPIKEHGVYLLSTGQEFVKFTF